MGATKKATAASSPEKARARLQEQTTAINEALLVAGLRQHELTEAAEKLNVQLQTEIIERKQAEEKLRASEVETERARDYAEATLRTAPIPLLVLRADLRVNTANEAFYRNFQVAPAETEGALIYDLGNRQWNIPELRELLEEILPKDNFFNDFEITHEFETIGRRTMLLNARRMENEAGQPLQIVLAIEDITDRKQASQYARSLLEASLDPLVTISADGKITDVNEGSIKVTGVARDKLIGTDFSDYFTEPEKAREGYQQVFARGFVTDYPLTIRHQDDRLTDVLYNASIYKDVSGNVLGVFAAARDITERNRVEEALRESEVETKRARDYAEATLRTAPIPLLVLEADLRVNTASDAFYKNFQVAPAETEGALIYDLGNRQWNIPKLRELLEEILPKNKVFNDYEVTHEFETIGRRTMLLNARRMENEAGQPLRIVLAIEDITERVRAEALLRQNREVFLEVIEQAPVGVYVLDGQMRMQHLNSLAQPTFAAIEPLIGRDFAEVIRILWPPERADGIIEIFRHTLATGEPYTAPTFSERRQDRGTEESYDWQLRRIILPDGTRGLVCYFNEVTERQRSELALRTSEENYRLLVEGATGFAIIRLDFSGRVTMWNVGAARIFGYEEAEILGEHFSRFFTPEQIADGMPEREMTEASAKEKCDDDNQLVRKDGSRFWANGATTALRDEAGKLTGFAKIVRDVSDHRRAHEALRTSESLKSAILTGALDAIITMDHEGKVVDFNPAAERTFGFASAEIVGQSMVEKIIPERLRGAYHAGLAHYLKSGEARVLGQRIEVPARHADGHEFTIELSSNRIAGSEPAMFTATLRDITERLAAEAALRESEERFRVAVRAVSNIVWTNSAEGEMLGAQPGWGHFTGQTQEEYQGYGWADAVHPDDAQPTIEAWNLAVADRQPFHFEHRVRRHDGVWRRCSIRALPTLGPGGEIREWVGVHNDVTDERAAADALLAAKEQAEAANRAKDDFLAALSHELRTPLTPVLMTATALESDPLLTEEVREQLGMMRRNIQLEARLIDDLLDLTRISRGKLTIAPVAADLHQLIQHTAEIVRSDGLGKQVRIVFVLDAARHHALADPTRIQQVFWNLIKNALKFTPTGGTITVSTYNDAEGWIVVRVEDTGVGISAEALPHIFKAFEQGDVAGQHRYGGLGLGLAISQAIMGAHGGIIRVASEGPGRGATFTAAFPCVDASAAPAPGTAAHPAPARGLRLLIVEDHEATRTVLTRLLTRGGHQVTTASTVADALTAFAGARFDAVVSDLGLPDGSGLDLMREIQRMRPVPAIALSGYGMEEDVRQTKEAGFFAHLVKPVNLDQLRQLLDGLAR